MKGQSPRASSSKHTRISKFLSLVLRHQPELIGLELDRRGWAEIDQLLAKAIAHGKSLDRDSLLKVVANNDKQRFTLSEDGLRIRAAQGHSIPVSLGYQPCQPPAQLFHGTASRFLEAIREQGLNPRSRQQVHLSAERETALKVGQRHGKAVILRVDSARMAGVGFLFYLADNGVWLTDHVPAEYLAESPQ